MVSWEEFKGNYKPEVMMVITEWQEQGGSVRDLAEYITAWVYAARNGSANIKIELEDWPKKED